MTGSGKKSSLTVLYGQPDHLSTSFQSTQLVRALEPWLVSQPLRITSTSDGPWRRHLSRLTTNYIKPLFTQPGTDYLLYGNDGLADLSHWRSKRLLYWYDAPWDWSRQPPKLRQWLHWLRYRNILAADYVFAVSHAQLDVARRLRPGREDSVIYLPVGVDCRFFNPVSANGERVRQKFKLPDKIIIGYLGYIGIGYLGSLGSRAACFAGQPLIEVARELLRQCDVHFLIVGFGPGLNRFKERVTAVGLDNHFTFTGRQPPDALPDLLAAMDICVDTLEEGFHSEARSETKLKQYMAMGRACVATAIGENRLDLDHGNCGILVEPGNENLLSGLLVLCNNPHLRAELGNAARRRAEDVYDWPKLATRFASALGLA
jgi:glycosyltransferase involved in cell wall biosynthesis